MFLKRVLLTICVSLSACTGGQQCDSNRATNKMLALNKIQARVMADGGEVGTSLGLSMTKDIGAVSELIAQQKYNEACAKADAMAKMLEVDLDEEQKDMLTIEQLAKDGGKGNGTCSLADAAKMNMEVHGLLQKEVDAGRMDSEIFRTYNDDTRSLAELMSTNPSKACELLEGLKVKYKLKS